MQIQPYLFFDGRCEEALAFYRDKLGAEGVMLMRFKDAPENAPAPPGVDPEKVMHARFKIGDTELLASDGRCGGRPTFQGFSLTLAVRDEAEAEQRFSALADGGQIQMPLAATFFSPRFGMLTDRFGVMWMVYIAK